MGTVLKKFISLDCAFAHETFVVNETNGVLFLVELSYNSHYTCISIMLLGKVDDSSNFCMWDTNDAYIDTLSGAPY